MFRITPIGSCRITTPLRLARDGFGFQLNLDRVYGFCHSSAEAVQMMRYLQGGIDLDPALAPLIARRGRADERESERHPTSDLYVVELSSAKELRIGQTSIQLNYVIAHFAGFFADRLRAARFWEHAEADDQKALDDLLAAEWNDDPLQAQEATILRQIRRRSTPETDLRRDIRSLIDGLPATLFVTHVDALAADGLPIPSRSRFIESVEAAVRAEGGVLYNPTAAMTRMGQINAIEDESDSLAHFTEDFSRAVFQDWFDLTIEARIDRKAHDGSPAEVRRVLVPHVTARLAAGEITSLVSRLDRLVLARPESSDIRSLLAGAYAAAGKSAGALAALRAIPNPPDPADRTALLQRRFYLALDLADASEIALCLEAWEPLSPYPPPRDLASSADILRNAGYPALALAVLLRVLRSDTGVSRVAEAILEILQQEPRLQIELQPKDVEQAVALLAPAYALALLELVGNADRVHDLVTAPGRVDAGDLADLVGRWTKAARIGEAAVLVAAWRNSGRADRISHPSLRRLIDTWVARAIYQPDRGQRVALLEAALLAHPLHVEGRLALRAARRDILADLRALVNAGDLAALQSLQPEIARLREPMPEYALGLMRLLHQSGAYSGAIVVAQEILAKDPDHLIAWVTLMRAAQKTGDLLTLETAAKAIIARADDDCRRIEDEARDRLERNPVLCFRAARNEADPLRAHRLFSISLRSPALSRAAGLRLRRIEAELAATLRDSDRQAEPGMEALARAAATLVPANPRLSLSLGRYLYQQQDYAAALPLWEFLANSAPGNESYALQANRCRARLEHSAADKAAQAFMPVQ